MKGPVIDLARPELRDLTAYSSARSLTTEDEGLLFLDANEAPSSPPGASDLRHYPEPQPFDLRERLAELYGVSPETLLMLRGADEAIDLCLRAFCRAGEDAILISPPTYGMYAISARIQGAAVEVVPQRSRAGALEPDLDRLVERVESGAGRIKLVFLCSPNNPTGAALGRAAIEDLIRRLEGRALLVLDEAYIEFADVESAAGILPQNPGLVILRTLSKAWGLAGARFGCLLADQEIVALLERIRPPYPLSAPAIEQVRAALTADGSRWMRAQVRELQDQRAWLARALASSEWIEHVFPSQANFLLVRTADARAFVERCRAHGVVVRDRSQEAGLANCVRVSVGSAHENGRLMRALVEQGEEF